MSLFSVILASPYIMITMKLFSTFIRTVLAASAATIIYTSTCEAKENRPSAKAAREVITRFAGENLPVKLSLNLDKQDGRDVYVTTVTDGKLSISGSSPVALCRGFYKFMKDKGAAINSWSGNRFVMPELSGSEAAVRTESPYRDHYYLNVVTYGYTMPYWDRGRWEKEIDWMALHGIDMPLALVAQEAISRRVWLRLGLTEEEIDSYFVGPAHLPWMRMGNISGIDGPLPASWHTDQIKLQHFILDRMKSLGMKPICPGFAGFVPQAIKRVHPEAKLMETSWCDGAFHNWMLSPDQPLFRQIGRMYIEEWEKEFGKNERYIADSFNEMEIPFPAKTDPARYTMLADYGEAVYRSITDGNPDAIWVMQGWMFGYQRNIWDAPTLKALVSKVPDDRIMLLDLAEDYNHCFWQNGANWEFYDGFFNKSWVYSVIPNMGGKTAPTGNLEFYANGGRLKALRSAKRGNLTGYGLAPEGIENNEIIYELICDGGWTADSIPLDKWLDNYATCRYGQNTPELTAYWDGLQKSVYGSFTDHPRFKWQFRPGVARRGTVMADSNFRAASESLLNASGSLSNSPLYINDLIDATVHTAGAKLEQLTADIDSAIIKQDSHRADSLIATFTDIALSMDRLLLSHPDHRMEKWIEMARAYGRTEAEKGYYETNARRIATIWGPPVDDYSARIWSGLIRDYYLPRWLQHFESLRTGHKFDFATWERQWVEQQKGFSEATALENPVEGCVRLMDMTR